MISLLIDTILQFIAFILGVTTALCLVALMVRMTIAAWKYIPQALIGPNGTMEPIELASVITGQLSIFILMIAPFMNYKYDHEIFYTVFAAFCFSTGVYAYKAIKNGNNHKVPKK
jgi:cytochrome bd-type quinol oxidase subunit 1